MKKIHSWTAYANAAADNVKEHLGQMAQVYDYGLSFNEPKDFHKGYLGVLYFLYKNGAKKASEIANALNTKSQAHTIARLKAAKFIEHNYSVHTYELNDFGRNYLIKVMNEKIHKFL